MIYECWRNENSTNNNEKSNETCRNNQPNKCVELTKEIDQPTNLPKYIVQSTNKSTELTKGIDQPTKLPKYIVQSTNRTPELTK